MAIGKSYWFSKRQDWLYLCYFSWHLLDQISPKSYKKFDYIWFLICIGTFLFELLMIISFNNLYIWSLIPRYIYIYRLFTCKFGRKSRKNSWPYMLYIESLEELETVEKARKKHEENNRTCINLLCSLPTLDIL